MEAFNYKGELSRFGGPWADGLMCPPCSGCSDHLVSTWKLAGVRLAGNEQADGYGSPCEEPRTQPGTVSTCLSLHICDTNWPWKSVTCAAAELSSGFVQSLLRGDGQESVRSQRPVPGGLQAVLHGRFGCQGCLSGSVVWRHSMAQRNGSFGRFQSPGTI